MGIEGSSYPAACTRTNPGVHHWLETQDQAGGPRLSHEPLPTRPALRVSECRRGHRALSMPFARSVASAAPRPGSESARCLLRLRSSVRERSRHAFPSLSTLGKNHYADPDEATNLVHGEGLCLCNGGFTVVARWTGHLLLRCREAARASWLVTFFQATARSNVAPCWCWTAHVIIDLGKSARLTYLTLAGVS